MDSTVLLAVLVTCVLGYGMSYLSWALRAEVSALTFVVIGILCKIASVVINAVFLSKHLTVQVCPRLKRCLFPLNLHHLTLHVVNLSELPFKSGLIPFSYFRLELNVRGIKQAHKLLLHLFP